MKPLNCMTKNSKMKLVHIKHQNKKNLTNFFYSTGTDPNPLASAYMSTAAGLPQFSSTALSTSPLASVALSSAAAAAAGKQIEGKFISTVYVRPAMQPKLVRALPAPKVWNGPRTSILFACVYLFFETYRFCAFMNLLRRWRAQCDRYSYIQLVPHRCCNWQWQLQLTLHTVLSQSLAWHFD